MEGHHAGVVMKGVLRAVGTHDQYRSHY
jgi:hypothetical protein